MNVGFVVVAGLCRMAQAVKEVWAHIAAQALVDKVEQVVLA